MANIGLFGKMPSMGDFVSRGWSPALCESIDKLLQSALVATTQDGSDGRQVMEQARPVMIAIRPGALCASGFSGLCFPSRDRVGRAFPLCVGLETDAEGAGIPLLWPSQQLTLLLCTAVVKVLQAGGGPDDLLAALPQPGEWDASATGGIPFSDVGDETVPDVSFRGSMFALQGPEKDMSVASRALSSRLPWVAQVLGTVVGADGSPEWFFGSRSMLVWTQFAALFDGRWAHWEWTATPLVSPDETLPGPAASPLA
jgi:type VI secretion system ImpM family protein